ncbi:MAG: butyrate kinase [Paludibacteraceae bacterium]
MYKILVINPGSTSTKIAIYEDDRKISSYTIRHSSEDTNRFKHIIDQLDYRYTLITDLLKVENIDLTGFSAIIGRGGMLPPVQSGIYAVNEPMLAILRKAVIGEHASNLGAFLAYKMAEKSEKCLAYIADPVAVDEMSDIARIGGLPEVPRRSMFHALNHKAVARFHAEKIGKRYEELNLIVAHLGGGITVGAHKRGRVVDVNQGLDGYGPFAPERSGTLDVGVIVKMCYSGKFTQAEMLKKLAGKGGLTAHCGTNDVQELERRIEKGDEYTKLVLQAMAYTIAKEIMSLFTVFKGKNDGVVITGGIAYSKFITDMIKSFIEPFADIYIYPGEDELQSLALSALRALNGEEVKYFDTNQYAIDFDI